MKKVFVFSKDTAGGLRTFINSLVKIKNNVSLLFFFLKKDPYYHLEYTKHLKKDGVLYLNEFYPSNNNVGFNKILLFIINFVRSGFLIKKNHPDTIITLDYYSFILIAFVKIFFWNRFKWIATHHTDVVSYINLKPVLFRFFLKKILLCFSDSPNINIFVSIGIKNRFISTVNKRIKYQTIYNGLASRKKTSRMKPPDKDRRCKLITVGRLDVQKDYDTLLSVAKKLSNARINILLYLIGEGPLKSQLLTKINKLKINKNVIITGYVQNIFSYLKKSHIFLFSSFYEGFGYTILEAMSCGLPIIATNSPSGPAEILGYGKYGILVPIEDVQSFVTNIKKLINHPKLYEKYSKLSLLRADDFSEEKMLERYLNIIKDPV